MGKQIPRKLLTTHQQSRLDPPHPSSLIQSIFVHAAERPNASALIELNEGGKTCTWSELADLTAHRALVIRQRLAADQAMVTILPSGIESVAWFCAAIAAGVRVLPMHTQIAGPEARSVIEKVDAQSVVFANNLKSASMLGPHSTRLTAEDIAVSPTNELPTEHAGGVLLESSGTSGLPKLALRESSALDAVARNVIDGIGLLRDDRIVFPTPLSHSYGVDVMVASLTAGSTLCITDRFDADQVAREIESGATVLLSVPFIYETLAKRYSPRKSTLRIALSAGSQLLGSIHSRFFQTWGVQVGQLYGATELGTVAMSIPGSDSYATGSIGHPLPEVEMTVASVDNPNLRVEIGQEGQLLVRSSSMMRRYLSGEADMANGFFLTGDLARMDDSGRYWITGRIKLIVDVGSYKVNPLEVEQVLNAHPMIDEAVVLPLTQSPTMTRLQAVVVPCQNSEQVTSDHLRLFMKERLSIAKVPRVIHFVPSLPKSPTGKIRRDKVLDRWGL